MQRTQDTRSMAKTRSSELRDHCSGKGRKKDASFVDIVPWAVGQREMLEVKRDLNVQAEK